MEKLTPERRRQQTRDALVDAAAQVFAHRGFNGASLDEIAEAAGFTRGAIYKNFAGKEDLFFAVFDRWNAQALDGFREMVGPGGSFTESFTEAHVDEIAARWIEGLARDPDFYALELEVRLFALRNPKIRKLLAAHSKKTEAMISDFVAEQMTAAGVANSLAPSEVGRLILAASEGIRNAIYLDASNEDLYGRFLQLLIAGLAAMATPAKST